MQRRPYPLETSSEAVGPLLETSFELPETKFPACYLRRWSEVPRRRSEVPRILACSLIKPLPVHFIGEVEAGLQGYGSTWGQQGSRSGAGGKSSSRGSLSRYEEVMVWGGHGMGRSWCGEILSSRGLLSR